MEFLNEVCNTLWENAKILVTRDFSFFHSFEKSFHTVIRTQSLLLMTLKKKPLENIAGKGENAGIQHFLLFRTIFSILSKTNFNFLGT